MRTTKLHLIHLLVRIVQCAPVNDIHQIEIEVGTGSNLLNNNVNAMSLAWTHPKCRPHSSKLGINTDLRPAAVGPY